MTNILFVFCCCFICLKACEVDFKIWETRKISCHIALDTARWLWVLVMSMAMHVHWLWIGNAYWQCSRDFLSLAISCLLFVLCGGGQWILGLLLFWVNPLMFQGSRMPKNLSRSPRFWLTTTGVWHLRYTKSNIFLLMGKIKILLIGSVVLIN